MTIWKKMRASEARPAWRPHAVPQAPYQKALTDQVAQAGRARVYHDQTGVRVGQVHVLQNKVHSDHGQNAGEQVDGNGQVLQQLAALEAAAAYGVSHHQHKAGGDHTVKACHNQGVHEPARELCNRVRLCHNADVVPHGKAFRHKAGKVDALIGGERGQQQPGDGYQPDKSQQRQHQMADDGEDAFFTLPCLSCFCAATEGTAVVLKRTSPPSY